MMNHSENGDMWSKGVSVAMQQILMSRHDYWNDYISVNPDPICPKLHELHTRPGQNTSTLKIFEKVTAPPNGNKKFRHYIWRHHCFKLCHIILKIGQLTLHPLTMPQWEDFEIWYNAVAVATWFCCDKQRIFWQVKNAENITKITTHTTIC